ncbi:MAG: PhoPQ-activated pathogenicity-related family protein [Verrucomicrobia bacterium]|nr:PhoPQ-activated pathogenicity-related family protein [Verrucomicrobiota bacterium]
MSWALACALQPALTTNAAPSRAAVELTALDRYVAAADTNYSFKVLNTVQEAGVKAHILEMTSQAWLTSGEVNQPVWKHWLTITRPDQISSSKALLIIGGGRNDKGPPKGPDANVIRIAKESKSVVAELRNVPNQPLIFNHDGQPRVEDDLIAYTWDKFLRTGDERWPARLPMTKSAVRAMDTVISFCGSTDGGSAKLDGFVVAGGSKRGWTTWTTAAVDPRVVAIVPIVIDVLNIEPSMRHHYAAYGFWAPAVGDYTNHGIMNWMGTPQFRALAKIEEPYEYRSRYTMPKLMLNATGDQFFLPDSSQYYFDDLPGPKYLRYVPNADHSLKDTDAWTTLQAFYESILTSAPLPRFSWTLEKDGSIRVKATDKPNEVKLWQATNPDARDFRLETFGPQWISASLESKAGVYVGRVTEPPRGWTAFMVELTFTGPRGTPLKLTTNVRVVPDKTNYKFMPQPPVRIGG